VERRVLKCRPADPCGGGGRKKPSFKWEPVFHFVVNKRCNGRQRQLDMKNSAPSSKLPNNAVLPYPREHPLAF